MSDFKTFSKLKFKNIKTAAMIEFAQKPVELILNVSFSITPTKKSKEYFTTIYNYHEHLRKNKIGEKVLHRTFQKNVLKNGWFLDDWCGVSYTYCHNISQINFNKKSNFGIDFLLILPYKCYDNKHKNEIRNKYLEVANDVSNLQNFSSDEFSKIECSRKNEI